MGQFRQSESDEILRLSFNPPIRCYRAGTFYPKRREAYPARRPDLFELIFVQRGNLSLVVDSTDYQVSAGQSVILWPGKRHYGAKPNDLDLFYCWAYFALSESAQSQDGQYLLAPQYQAIARPDIVSVLFSRLISDNVFGNPTDGASSADILLTLILIEIGRKLDEGAVPRHDASLAGAARALIAADFPNDIGASSIAARLNCSPDYLGRLYRSAYGSTLTEDINKQRIEHAVHLLTVGELAIEEIATECGFQDSGYFRRVFKRSYGVTPLKYRNLHGRAKWQV